MKKFHYIICCMLLLFSVCGFALTGCGGNINNLKVSLTSDALVTTNTEGVYDLTLVKSDSDDDETWSATIDATVTGLSGNMLGDVQWSFDSMYIDIDKTNESGTSVVIKGVTSTSTPTIVTAFSVENREAEAIIRVTNIVQPKAITSCKYGAGELGIPLNVPTTLAPADLFVFNPIDATIPQYEYTIGGILVDSNEPFTLTGLTDGYVSLTARPKDVEGLSDEEIQALSFTIDRVRIYEPLTDENIRLVFADTQEEVEEVTLIKNAGGNKNEIRIKVNSTVAFEYTKTSKDNIIYDEINNPKGELRISYNPQLKEFTLIGLDSREEFAEVSINFSIAGVKNSLVLSKKFLVRIVDYPTGIIVNDVAGASDISVRVFDQYASGESGTALKLSVSPRSQLFNGISIRLDEASVTDLGLVTKLLINGEPFNGQRDGIKSDDTLYLRNDGGYGSFAILVYASSTMGTMDEVCRRVIINLEQSVTDMSIDGSMLDSISGNLILELDEYDSNTSSHFRELTVNVEPASASFDTVSVSSSNPNIIKVETIDVDNARILITAQDVGYADVVLTAMSGVTYTIPVRVTVRLRQITIDLSPDISSVMVGKGLTQYKSIEVGSPDRLEPTLMSAYIAKTGSGNSVTLINNFYPITAAYNDMIEEVRFVSSNETIATMSNSTSSIFNNVLSTFRAGTVTFDLIITYRVLEGTSLVSRQLTYNSYFTITVFDQITSIDVSDTNVELLAGVDNIDIGDIIGGGSSSVTQSVYDLENNSKTLNVSVYPDTATTQASSAVWTIDGNTSKISFNSQNSAEATGSEATVIAKPLYGNETRISVTVIVSITDYNGETFTKEIRVVSTKIQLINDVYINNYTSSLKNNSLYFELFKDDGFTLDVSVSPVDATNKNLEYIIFDAELLPGFAMGNDIISVSTGATTGNKYQYYRILSRDPSIDSVYSSQYNCKNATLVKDDDGLYTIKPKQAGYAFVFIIPQDTANQRVDTITELTDQLRNVTDRSTIKRIPITIADGNAVPYQLYTAEDVASIGSSVYGLDKNYYVMNTIDMSAYINKQLASNPNWEWTPIGSVTTPFAGNFTSMVYNGETTTQSIVGWSLSRNLSKIEAGSTFDWRNFGIFGVVTGSISNINFYINNYAVTQSVRQEVASNPVLNNYNYGLVVGKITSSTKTVNQEEVTTYGSISNVAVNCARVEYVYTHQSTDKIRQVSANFGVVGYLDELCIAQNIDVTVVANLESDDITINFGGIVGKNLGIIGALGSINQYSSTADVTVSTDVTYDTNNTILSGIGGVAGYSAGEIYSARVLGTITTQNDTVVSGGAVGISAGSTSKSTIISNILSSVRLSSIDSDSTTGGVIGGAQYSTLSYLYFDIYSTLETNTGIVGSGTIGGIVGNLDNSTLEWAIAQAYLINSADINIISQGGVVGGLVGAVSNSTITKSFADLSISATSGVLGGLVGTASGNASINDVYVRGLAVAQDGVTAAAFVGRASDSASLTSAYAELSDSKLVAYTGTLAVNSVYTISDENIPSGAGVQNITRAEALELTEAEWYNMGFNATLWGIDKATSDATNDGYAYLKNADGTPFVRLIPQKIILTANTFDTMSGDKINPVLNVVGDNKKLIIAYQENAVYDLASLFTLETEPEMNPASISLNITLVGTSAAQLLSAGNFMSAQLRILGTGTVYMRISSSQNTSAYDVIQVCIVSSFDSFDIVDEDGNSLFEPFEGDDDFVLKIKRSGSTQAFVKYYIGENEVTNVSGGLTFITGLVRGADNELLTAVDSENNIVTNYKISIYDWQEVEYKGLRALALNIAQNDKIVLTAVGENRATIYITQIVPYYDVQFYELDSELNIIKLGNSIVQSIVDYGDRSFGTQLYYGVEDITMSAGDGTRVSAGEAFNSGVTIINDAYTPDMTVAELLWYQLYSIDEDGSALLIAYDDSTLPSGSQSLTSDYINVAFTNLQYYPASNAIVISYSIELSQSMRKNLMHDQSFRIVIGAIDDNGEKVADKVVSLDWTFIPQEIKNITIEHFSDAINTGSKLTQAGDTPTNTIVAGEYGLLRITISPDYAKYDRIEVISSVVNGSPMVFDQRVLEEVIDPTTKEVIYTYITWQDGVENITNGISLDRASLINGDFNGVFYVRTICLSTLTTGTQFTITVRVTTGEEVDEYKRTLTVYQTDVLSLEGEHYSDNLGSYIVAEGTGYTTSDTLVQNRNPLTVNIGSAYYDSELTVDEASAAKGARVVKVGNNYYLYTGSVTRNNIITVTLTAKQNIGGFTYRATRAISYEVVDFYISTIRTSTAMPTTKRFAFIDGKKYDLRLFEGINNDNLNTVTEITFDTSNIDTRTKVLETLNKINGIGTQIYNGWRRRTVEPDGRITFVALEPSENWIDNNYQFMISEFNEVNNGYCLVSSGISSGNILMYELLFRYDAGSFVLTNSQIDATFGLTTENVNVEFYQVTSQEHPQPVRTLNQLMSMEEDIDYILLNDLYITDTWTPLNVAVKSFNGNGYTIHFSPTSITPIKDANYGLFGTIDADSVIKNVNVAIDSVGLAPNNGEEQLSALNFGILAGVNYGTVYNCQVSGLNNNKASLVAVGTPTGLSAKFNVAGLVGTNAGGITNSRVVYLDIRASGNVSGLTVTNSGVVSGCYYTGGTITNLSESSSFATAGLVVENSYGASILSSYVGGTYTTTTDNVTTLDTRVTDVRDATIQSGVSSAGFVYSNYGTINDCYTGVKMFSTSMSGFVFTNYGSGKIARCYSTSILSVDGESIINSYPFIGASGDNATENNNFNKVDGIVNCYYYNTGFANRKLEEAKELTAEDFCGVNGTSKFNQFIFSRTGEEGSEFTGVWTFVDDDNLYFTADRFKSELILSSGESNLYTNFGPKLVNASLIATPRMLLYSSVENEYGEVVHTYVNKYTSIFDPNHTYEASQGNDDYKTDYTYDPIVVSSIAQFNDAFDINNESLAIRGEDGYEVILSDIRVVKSLSQNDLDTGVSLNSPTARYAGILNGNGFTFTDVNLAVNNNTTEYYGLIGKLTRVDRDPTDDINYIGTIKNYNVDISNVSCSTVPYVGGLSGIVDGGNLYDVRVTGSTARIIGGNVVGGIAGYVIGTSRVNMAYSNVGVTANYRANTEKVYNKDLIFANNFDTSLINDVSVLGYAGGLFGIVDITQFDTENPSSSDVNEARVYNIYTDGSASVVGKIAGGLIGGVGEYSVIYYANKYVQPASLVKGYVFAGGLVGQNNGFIKYGNLTYTTEVQSIVDKANTGATTTANMGLLSGATSPLGIGGIVGLNIGSSNINWPGGTILLCSSKVAVRDVTAQNAGGIAGVVYGGDIRACLATGSVMGSKTAYVGGIVGYLSDFSSDQSKLLDMDNPYGKNMVSNGTTLDYVVAQNNWLAQDYNYYYTLDNNNKNGVTGAIGGIVGFVYDSGLVYTTHTVATDSDDPYAYLTNPTNYFISQFTNRTISINQVNPITSGTYFDMYLEDDHGVAVVNKAVGMYGTDNSINLGLGKTRGYMIRNFDEIFAGWDQYSINNDTGTPSIGEQDLPNIIEVDSIEDLKIMYWHPEKTYVLVDDIDFQDYTADPELGKRIKSAFFAIGSESSPFTGSFYSRKKADGSLPRIKSVYIINSGASSLGFFGAINNADIHDIIIENIHYSTAINENAKATVGALAGVATNSRVTNVSILNTDIENSGIYTNANVVGGMFGKIRSLGSGKSVISDCYVENNLVLTDNLYSNIGASGSMDTYLGGFAGIIEGNVETNSCISAGQMNITYTDMTLATMADGSGAREIAHVVGGFAGQINGLQATQNASVSGTAITLNNVMSHTRAGGFVGIANETNLYKVDSHSTMVINLNNLTDQKTMYVGGLIGEFMNNGGVQGFISASDITIRGQYGVDTLSNITASNHYVAGIVGYFGGINSTCANGYSVTSITNETTFLNTDTTVGYATTAGISKISILADKYYSFAQSDNYRLGTTSATVQAGGGLDTTGEMFSRNNRNEYYRIKADWGNTQGSTLYDAMYKVGTGEYKTAPILVNDWQAFSKISETANEYKYYLQTADIDATNKLYGDSQLKVFRGVYNGGGYVVRLPAHFDINDGSRVTDANVGLFGQVQGEENRGSVLTGVVIANVLVYANLSTDVQAVGLLAGTATTGTLINNCYVSGEINLNILGDTVLGGMVGKSGARFVGCATDITANLYGTGNYKYGALYGSAIAQDSGFVIMDSYTAGKVNNYGSNGITAGVVADSSVSSLYARNSYTMTEINTVATSLSAPVAYSLNSGGVHNVDGILYDPSNLLNTNSATWDTYSYADVNRSNTLDLGQNYTQNNSKNYGMPVLNWLNTLVDTSILPSTGTGIAGSAYQINTATQLAWALNNATYGTAFVLTDDIDYMLLSNARGYSTTDFLGSLDGNFHYIKNLSSNLVSNIGGSITKLGFDNVSTTGNILANSISGGSASVIYVNSQYGQVVGSGRIENSASAGASFGTDAVNCFTSTMSDSVYNTLDYNTWAYDGNKYVLRDFLQNLGSTAKPFGEFAISEPNGLGVQTIRISSAQDLANAIFYTTNFAGKYAFEFVNYPTVDLQNNALVIPNSVQSISGVNTLQNGLINNSIFSKINSNTINILNNGIYFDNFEPMFGSTSDSYNSINIQDSKIVATNEGGLLFDTLNNNVNITLKDLSIFVKNENIHLIASSADSSSNGYQTSVENIVVYGYNLLDLIGSNSATTEMTVSNVSGENGTQDAMFEYIITGNSANITLNLSNLALNSGIIKNNSGQIILNQENVSSDNPLFDNNTNNINIELSASKTLDSPIANTNSGTITITGSNSAINSVIVNTNNANGKINVTLTDTQIKSALLQNNLGELEISLDGCTLSNALMSTNNGAITITLQDTVLTQAVATINTGTIDMEVIGGEIASEIVSSNSNSLTLDVQGNTAVTINTSLVGTNTGTVDVTLNNATVAHNLITTNAGTFDIIMKGGSSSTALIGTNNLGANVTVNLSGRASVNSIITTNNGTATISIQDGVVITGNAVGTNTGAIDWSIAGSIDNYLIGTLDSSTNAEITLNNTVAINHSLVQNVNSALTITLENVNSTSYLVDNNNSALNVNISGGTIYGVVQQNGADGVLTIKLNTAVAINTSLVGTNTGTVDVTLNNATVAHNLITTNAGTFDISMKGGSSGTALIGTNNLGANATVNLSGGASVNSVIATNDGTATISIQDGVVITGNAVGTNTGTVTINIEESYTNNSADYFVNTNSGTVNINVKANTTLSNANTLSLINESSGAVNIAIEAELNMSASNVALVMNSYTGTQDTSNVTIRLNANANLTGTESAQAICLSGDFDANTRLQYENASNSYNIILNGVNYDPNGTTSGGGEEVVTPEA